MVEEANVFAQVILNPLTANLEWIMQNGWISQMWTSNQICENHKNAGIVFDADKK